MGCFSYEWPKFKRAALVVAAAVALYAVSRLVSREPRRKETHNGGSLAQTAPASRPNILLILADDMGYSDIGCFGSEFQTPHIAIADHAATFLSTLGSDPRPFFLYLPFTTPACSLAG